MSGLSLPLLIAVQFLTRLPVRLQAMPSDQQLGRSLLWYPLVGLLIGALLVLLQWCLSVATVCFRPLCYWRVGGNQRRLASRWAGRLR
uniref:Uncharacterized protein n=1 Tax=Pseudomonas marincola TaxID=437900 RepID=A0A653EBB2_9PSED